MRWKGRGDDGWEEKVQLRIERARASAVTPASRRKLKAQSALWMEAARAKSTQGRLGAELKVAWNERVDRDGEPRQRPVWREQVRLGAEPASVPTRPASSEAALAC